MYWFNNIFLGDGNIGIVRTAVKYIFFAYSFFYVVMSVCSFSFPLGASWIKAPDTAVITVASWAALATKRLPCRWLSFLCVQFLVWRTRSFIPVSSPSFWQFSSHAAYYNVITYKDVCWESGRPIMGVRACKWVCLKVWMCVTTHTYFIFIYEELLK